MHWLHKSPLGMILFAEILGRMEVEKFPPIMSFKRVLNSTKCQVADVWSYFAEKTGHKMRRVVFDTGCLTDENVERVLGKMGGLESLSVEGTGGGRGGVGLGGLVKEVGGMKFLRRLELRRLEVKEKGLEELFAAVGDKVEFLTLHVRFVFLCFFFVVVVFGFYFLVLFCLGGV